MNLSEYRGMWLFALFDLPVDSKDRRRAYARFRRKLLEDGFMMLQFSVYARYCVSEEASDVHRQKVKEAVPDEGQVRLLAVTDRQFGKMEVICGKKRVEPEKRPVQLDFF